MHSVTYDVQIMVLRIHFNKSKLLEWVFCYTPSNSDRFPSFWEKFSTHLESLLWQCYFIDLQFLSSENIVLMIKWKIMETLPYPCVPWSKDNNYLETFVVSLFDWLGFKYNISVAATTSCGLLSRKPLQQISKTSCHLTQQWQNCTSISNR